MGYVSILGPRGLPIVGSLLMLSDGLPHCTLASMAHSLAVIVKEILTSTHFGDRPINQSAQELMFDRAMGLAPGGAYWQLLRRLASLPTPFFAAKPAAFSNIMGLVFGRRYHENTDSHKAKELNELVKEEWIMAELVFDIQSKLQCEIDMVVGKGDNETISSSNLSKRSYLHAIVKEGLGLHPPGPLSSWARLPTSDVQLSNGMVVPSGITAMVNMCATIHDPNIREDPLTFKPERFQDNDFDVRGTDLRLEPFGAGQRVCPGRNLGLAVVTLWVARLVQHFQWTENKDDDPVNLEEVLKLSCEMKKPLCVVVVPTNTRSMFSP
ncbi:hypothetical protein Ancab_036224 [Ancistrocladus abbreviatus]